MSEVKGYIHSTESFGSVDGPGVRFIIFVSGMSNALSVLSQPGHMEAAGWRTEDNRRTA